MTLLGKMTLLGTPRLGGVPTFGSRGGSGGTCHTWPSATGWQALVPAAVLLLLVLLHAADARGQPPATVLSAPAAAAVSAGRRPLTPDEEANIRVYEGANRSVVNVNTKGTVTAGLFLFEVPSEGAGSASVIDRQGHLLTNYHVVEGANEIQVVLYDGSEYLAKLVGFDVATDVAVLRIDAPAELLEPVIFGSSSDLQVGQRVFAIGNPFGLERTLTTGIISSLNRSLPTRSGRTIKSIIQTDAAINPGNSGGPLLDSQGLLIGMNTAIASRTGQSAGVGFAIPVATLARVVPQLILKGRVTRADPGIARVYQTEKGLLVAGLVPDGPAERAGIRGFKLVRERRRQGPFMTDVTRIDRTGADTILAVDGKPTKTADDFLSAVETRQPGERVLITVEREGRRLDVPVILDEAA